MLVYQREPHARQMAFRAVQQPRTLAERAELARLALRDYELACDVWIDDMSDQSRRAFGDLPHWSIVLDGTGRIAHKLPWTDVEELARSIEAQRWNRAAEPPAETRFEAAVTGRSHASPATAAERHDRSAMLAWLVEHEPGHPERARWLLELAATGPLPQRDWATALLRTEQPPGPAPRPRLAEDPADSR